MIQLIPVNPFSSIGLYHQGPTCSFEHYSTPSVYHTDDDIYYAIQRQRAQSYYLTQLQELERLRQRQRQRQRLRALAIYQRQQMLETQRKHAIALHQTGMSFAKASTNAQRQFGEWVQEPSYEFEMILHVPHNVEQTDESMVIFKNDSKSPSLEQSDKPSEVYEKSPIIQPRTVENEFISESTTSDQSDAEFTKREEAVIKIQRFINSRNTIRKLKRISERLSSLNQLLQGQQVTNAKEISRAEEEALHFLDVVDGLKPDNYDGFVRNEVRLRRRQIVHEVQRIVNDIQVRRQSYKQDVVEKDTFSGTEVQDFKQTSGHANQNPVKKLSEQVVASEQESLINETNGSTTPEPDNTTLLSFSSSKSNYRSPTVEDAEDKEDGENDNDYVVV